MDSRLQGKRFLLTGASGGIGQATAHAFAAEGALLALHCHSNREAAAELAASLPAPALVVQADLRRESDVEAMFAAIDRDLGPLDGVVVNAGVWVGTPVPLHTMSREQWDETMALDLTSAFLTCRGYLRELARAQALGEPRERASIVLVGSTAALFGEENHADYSAAKAAMTYGLTRTLKNEIVRLAPRGRVNCVCPGWVATPMSAAALEDRAAVARYTSTMALAKVATPEDVAAALVFLSSDALAGHLSGTILPLAGGMEGRVLHGELRS